MLGMKELLERVPQKRTMAEIMKEIYEDIDIKDFIEKHKDYIDTEMLVLGSSVLNEYIRMRDDEHYIPELQLFEGRITITYKKRDTPLNLKYRDRVPSKLFYDHSTAIYKGVSLDDYETDMNNANAFGYIDNFINTYQYGEKCRGLWLMGKFGIGKTYLMAGLATALHEKNVGVNFISMNQLVNDLYEMTRNNSKDVSIQKKIHYLQKSEVLIIDDIGTEKITRNNTVDVLYTILKYRGDRHKPTFITSNLTKDEYYTLINSKNLDITRKDISRLKEQIDVLMPEMSMSGVNRRDKA